MPLFWLYKKTMTFGKPVIHGLIQSRLKKGKEDPERVEERFGRTTRLRPEGPLLWIHVASVGEAQSILILVDMFLKQNPDAHVMVTSITTTSAALLESRLPDRAFHQYLPVDRPKWVRRFLDHWQPTIILWAESELWPALLAEIGKRHLPMALVNARMSPRSFRNWSRARPLAESILKSFTVILTQTDTDRDYYMRLGGRSVVTTGNIKFAAQPLPAETTQLDQLKAAIGNRPCWVYASTHDGEEELALETHAALTATFPDLLTIIIPRHPERRNDIFNILDNARIPYMFRGINKAPPTETTQIYVADTLGELGLFYRLSPIACIGRSFSRDGGGGHNPLEATLLNAAVLHGPHVQNLQEIYAAMDAAGAALKLGTPNDLVPVLRELLSNNIALKNLQQKGYDYAHNHTNVLNKVIEELEPLFLLASLPLLKGLA